MPVQFHKMHGAGNDFVLLDYRESGDPPDSRLAAHLADRKLGVGCDQILVLESSTDKNCAAGYRVFNADGSSAGQCGNGVRCIALYLMLRGEFGPSDYAREETAGTSALLEGPSGLVTVRLCDDGEFECDMGEPNFEPSEIPLNMIYARPAPESQSGEILLEINGQEASVTTVSMGNPHAVSLVESTRSTPVEVNGPLISKHSAFPEGCNAGFAEIIDRDNIHLRVYERGAGETLACGSGACAAVVALSRKKLVSPVVNVFLPGGHLVIKWNGPGHQVTMKGPAEHVFRGTLDE
ncbi:MAG TPA: diaminopimelate epimerase [Xanthomonadales bacterium]|nr:diaminopimelate epimerase [Xanthomonadales bacterium]